MSNEPPIDDIMGSQKRYYELRAPDYSSWAKPADRAGRSLFPEGLARPIFHDLRPVGHVLELACGPGPLFTSELARYAESVTALDASGAMLALNQARVARANVSYIETDVFQWVPERSYDFVFFGHWLSHVPSARFVEFWELVRRCTGDDGRVAFIDEDDRAAWTDSNRPSLTSEVARRTLADGRTFDIIKVFWVPDDLQQALSAIGWDIHINRLGDSFMLGVGTPI